MSNQQMKRAAFAGLFVLVFAGVAGAHAMMPARAQSAAASSATTAAQDTFNQNMQVMRAQMLQLRATNDPAARSKLLAEHMRTMQGTMQMMMGRNGMGGPGAGMGPGRGAGMGPGMMQGGGMRGSGPMGNGWMMQMMLNQMAQHQQAMQAMGCLK